MTDKEGVVTIYRHSRVTWGTGKDHNSNDVWEGVKSKEEIPRFKDT